jgi:hypothetical protein
VRLALEGKEERLQREEEVHLVPERAVAVGKSLT